ncbi:MAG: hypothetical protein PHQ04_06450 [Opitutaceae bacterium]|nr:hypothetical protein [Opitutaceae bacterium]
MSDPNDIIPPGRTPVFTTLLVLACFAAVGWIAYRIYAPTRAEVAPNPADYPAEQRWRYTPAGRQQYLADLRVREQVAATTYGWVDQKAGVVRIPISEAIKLTVRDQAASP